MNPAPIRRRLEMADELELSEENQEGMRQLLA